MTLSVPPPPSIRRVTALAPALGRGYRSLRKRSASLQVGVVIVALFVIAALVSLIWTPYPPDAQATGAFSAPPDASHLFGTDATGADIFSRALSACATDVGITLAVILLSLVIGTIWGSLVGYYGGWVDGLTLRILQVMNSFPSILLAMLVLSTFGRGMLTVIFVVALIPLPDYVRLSRAEILTKKNWQFAEAAHMIGRRPLAVLFRHLVPNSTRPLIAYAAVNASWVLSTVGALGFLGLGIQPGSAEWGSMISGGQSGIVNGQWWISFFPGVGIFLLAAAFHLIGDGMSDDDLARRGY